MVVFSYLHCTFYLKQICSPALNVLLMYIKNHTKTLTNVFNKLVFFFNYTSWKLVGLPADA